MEAMIIVSIHALVRRRTPPIYAESDFTPMEISWSGLLTAYDSGDIRRVTLVHDAANLNPTHQTAVFTKHQNSEPSLVAKIVGIEMHDSITDMIRVEPEEDDCAFNHVCSYLFYIINNGGTYKLFHTEYREQDGRTILITQNSSFGDSITADYVASTVFESSSPITNLHELSDHSVSFHNAGLIYTVSANGIVEIVENDPPQAHSPNAESTPTTETPSTPEPTDSATTITPEPETTTDIPSTPEPTEPETTTDIPSTPEPTETTTDIPSTLNQQNQKQQPTFQALLNQQTQQQLTLQNQKQQLTLQNQKQQLKLPALLNQQAQQQLSLQNHPQPI